MKPAMAVLVINAFPNAKLDFNWIYHGDLPGPRTVSRSVYSLSATQSGQPDLT